MHQVPLASVKADTMTPPDITGVPNVTQLVLIVPVLELEIVPLVPLAIISVEASALHAILPVQNAQDPFRLSVRPVLPESTFIGTVHANLHAILLLLTP